MDVIEQKVNVIDWLTDYKGTVIRNNEHTLVELTRKDKLNKWYITAPTIQELLQKLDNFLHNKVRL